MHTVVSEDSILKVSDNWLRCIESARDLNHLILSLFLLDPNKANQDKHGIIVDFGGEEGDAMFAVYDGHGENGHDCAAFASKQLPKSMIKFSKQKRSKNYIENLRREGKSTKRTWNPSLWPMLKIEEYKECCNKAFLETNEALHNDKGVSWVL
jgi:serine/threonine protein phosphatase PrpC